MLENASKLVDFRYLLYFALLQEHVKFRMLLHGTYMNKIEVDLGQVTG